MSKEQTLLKSKILSHFDVSCMGTTTMGTRGQVVVPADARRALKLKPGDKILVFVKFKNALGLIKAEAVSKLLDHMTGEFNKFKKIK